MKIIGIDGKTYQTLQQDLHGGAKFVIFQYCISIVILTFKRSSNIHFVPAGSSAVQKGLGFTLLSLVAGWWGIPWGPIYTVAAVANNLQGGRDVTSEVWNHLRRQANTQTISA
jgi:hypothetical protein